MDLKHSAFHARVSMKTPRMTKIRMPDIGRPFQSDSHIPPMLRVPSFTSSPMQHALKACSVLHSRLPESISAAVYALQASLGSGHHGRVHVGPGNVHQILRVVSTLPNQFPWYSIRIAAFAGEPAVVITGEFTWDLAAPATLMDINLTVPAGGFVAIVGPTGTSAPHPGTALNRQNPACRVASVTLMDIGRDSRRRRLCRHCRPRRWAASVLRWRRST